jgi:hypothetical protein
MTANAPVAPTIPPPIAAKLAAFGQLESEFMASFQFVQRVQGEARVAPLAIADIVRYLHALWVCESKDRLLSVPQTASRYEGARGLILLRDWQETGTSAEVVAFLQRRLDMLDFALITRQLEQARAREPGGDQERRLAHGQQILLNRHANLQATLEPIFALAADQLRADVQAAVERLGHTPDQIKSQLRDLTTPLYAFVQHPALVQRNMRLMGGLGVRLTADATDRPGGRTWRVAAPTTPDPPYAEQVISGYVALTGPWQNNLGGVRFSARPETTIPAPHPEPEHQAEG